MEPNVTAASPQPLRALIVDDHPMVVEALQLAVEMLRPGAIMHAAHSLAEGLSLVDTLPELDLVLLDLTLPDCQGLEGVQQMSQRLPQVPVLVCSGLQDPETIVSVLRSGARGFVPKTSAHQVLIDAMRLVVNGGIYVPPDALLFSGAMGAPRAGLSERFVPVPPPADLSPRRAAAEADDDEFEPAVPGAVGSLASGAPALTERQRQILDRLVEGRSNKEICRDLGISPNTVKTHVALIFRALGVATRAQAVTAAYRLGLRDL